VSLIVKQKETNKQQTHRSFAIMSAFTSFINKMRNTPRYVISNSIRRALISCQNRAYYLDQDTKKQSKLPRPNYAKIRRDFEAAGITTIPYTIDADDFNRWLELVRFPSQYVDLYGEVFVEKALEHYVGASLLQLEKDDTLIDVAAAHSPWYKIAERVYGCKGYALDREFPPGIDGRKIGSDATHMPLADGFASKMALHCAYETFEGTADIRLLAEAHRVLRENGQLVILPLYVDDFFYVLSSPYTDRRGLDYGGAELVWRDDPYRERFSRHYSVDAFQERIVANMNGFSLRIYCIENEREISPSCYLKFAALFEK
jgi:SAM-dependent methyltransferase